MKFFSLFSNAMKYYIQGNWTRAKLYFEKTEVFFAISIQKNTIEDYSDGPSKSILEFMHKYNYKCPRTWRGYRELVEK